MPGIGQSTMLGGLDVEEQKKKKQRAESETGRRGFVRRRNKP